jgi:hypothetical protein
MQSTLLVLAVITAIAAVVIALRGPGRGRSSLLPTPLPGWHRHQRRQ